MSHEEIHKQWNPFIIVISYSVSALGSYTTLQIISQTRSSAQSMFTVQMWLLLASFSFGGCAVWSMHFLGMMALDLGIEVGYEPLLTIVSLLVPVAASRIAFEFMRFSDVRISPPRRLCDDPADNKNNTPTATTANLPPNEQLPLLEEGGGGVQADPEAPRLVEEIEVEHSIPPTLVRRTLLVTNKVRVTLVKLTSDLLRVPCWRILVGGLFLATGVCSMHYIGMLAMKMNATVEWNWGYIIASFFIAWVAASSSLYIVSFCYLLWQHFIAALLMALAVCGMHYVGMAAATYYTTNDQMWTPDGIVMLNQNFTSIISIISSMTSFVFFGLASGNTTIARNRLEQEIKLQKEMEKLMMEKEAAELADRTKSAFVATVSHEIRTPMNIIIGATELLSSTKLDDEQKELTSTIQSSSRGLLSMINDILDFSKLNNKRMQLEILGFSPIEIAEDIVSMSGVAVAPDVDLLVRVDQNAHIRVLGDPVRFQQVIMNIVSNATKFTKTGYIMVEVKCTERSLDKCNLCISVEDTGIGINAEACAKIFEPFVQADSSYARRFGGTGLGLSVCKQLVDLMGGTIQVKSVLNKGTTFTCVFPFPLDAPQPTYQSHAVELTGRKCFLACRNFRSQEVLKGYLYTWGLLVQEFMEKLPNKIDFDGFDVILIDAELLSKVKIPTTCKKPMVVMNSSRQIPAEITEQTIFLRRPVIEGCLFAAIAIEALKLHRASPDNTRSRKLSISPSTGPASLAKKKRTQQGEIQQMKILLVEDNRLVQQIAIRLLQKLGPLNVSVADNGFEAVEMFKKENYDAIFMDCQMPVMDGFEATKRIRQLEQETQSSRTKIIALTAGVSEQLKKECLDAGMDSYIPKPVTLSMLRSALTPPDDEDCRNVEIG